MNKIGYCDRTWNPISGCDPISEGCQHCWAARMAKRLAGRAGYPKENSFAVTLHPDKLDEPLRWKKPQRIFTCSMSDLFHDQIPVNFFSDIMDRVMACPHHTFMMLTKRPERMKHLLGTTANLWQDALSYEYGIPHKNLWLIVTAENQCRADERIPILLKTPAAVRGVSLEPLLSRIGLARLCPSAHGMRNDRFHVIVGAETGPGARIMRLDWARSIRDQCLELGIPFWFKVDSHGNHQLDGQVWEQLPQGEACLNP